jgi:hypothetical protein
VLSDNANKNHSQIGFAISSEDDSFVESGWKLTMRRELTF